MATNDKADNDARIPCYFGFTSQKQWRMYLKALLKNNDNAVKKAVITIYNRQTFDEQLEQSSSELNGIGFSKVDAPFLSTVAIALISGKELDKKTFEITRNKMMRYWKQLMQISKTGLDDKLKEIKQRIEKEVQDDVRINPDSECNYHGSISCNSRQDAQGNFIQELLGEAEEDIAPDNIDDSGLCDNGDNDNPERPA